MDRPDTPALGFSRDGPNGPNAQIGLRVQRGFLCCLRVLAQLMFKTFLFTVSYV
jgi:hypothetical protein